MKTYFKLIGVLFVFVLMINFQAYAQRGTGNQSGIAKQFINPEIRMIIGELDHIKTGPCENTTGHAYIGTHLFLNTGESDTLINVHLGPADAVESYVGNLETGQIVEIQAFRTESMKSGEYVAIEVVANGHTLQLRDENLRPVWAGSRNYRQYRRNGRGGYRW